MDQSTVNLVLNIASVLISFLGATLISVVSFVFISERNENRKRHEKNEAENEKRFIALETENKEIKNNYLDRFEEVKERISNVRIDVVTSKSEILTQLKEIKNKQ